MIHHPLKTPENATRRRGTLRPSARVTETASKLLEDAHMEDRVLILMAASPQESVAWLNATFIVANFPEGDSGTCTHA